MSRRSPYRRHALGTIATVVGLSSMSASAVASAVTFRTEVATRGITGRVVVESPHGHVRGRPDLDLESSILVRVAGRERGEDGVAITEVEFIGVDAGIFDLRDALVFDDGGPIDRLEPLTVDIVSNLATDAPSDVFLAEAPPATIAGGYRTVLVAIGVAWLLVPVVVWIRRRLQRPPVPPAPDVPPTLRERIEPLVRLAGARDLTVDERGRLELLLLAHWREGLGLDDPAVAVRSIRTDPEAGRLLRRIETWLHAPDGRRPSVDEIDELLAPVESGLEEAAS